MNHDQSRRGFLVTNGFVVAAASALLPVPMIARPAGGRVPSDASWPGFPQQDPALVREVVGASHRNLVRVRELVRAHPELAKASYDWGFGDWESALGAASHVGNREIAEFLLESGARLDIFCAAMLGMTDAVRAMLTANPSLARTRGPHSISLLAHAEAGEQTATIEYLRSVPGSGESMPGPPTDEEIAVYLGSYTGEAGGPSIVVSKTKFGVSVKADLPGANEHRLFRTGEHTFHPAGAPGVRVTFTVAGSAATRIELVEDAWLVSATRTP